jgi:dolichol-phosphate mannosyltransferase
VIIDADLQDPPELIEEMAAKWQQGAKVVLAQRRSRKGENLLYLKCADIFYWLLSRISEVNVPRNTGDFRLLDARVVKEVRKFRERHGFLRGITAAAGFSTVLVPFDRDPRLTGRAKISWLGAIGIALDGIIPFSRIPVRVMLALGLIISVLAGLSGSGWLAYSALRGFSLNWALEALCLALIGSAGLTIACLGLIGEYLVRTYEETRPRPLYTVEEIVDWKGAEGKQRQDRGKQE